MTADARAEDSLDRAKAAGVLRYGTDTEGGAPYIYPNPADTRRYIGFEKELMDRLAARLGLTAQHDQENWDRLLSVLAAGRVDVVCNGFERTDDRLRDYIATRPYYVYQLQLLGRRDGRLDSWDDFRRPKPGGGRWRIGVLTNSVADRYLEEMARFYESIAGQPTLDVVKRDAVVDALREVENRQLDGTLQDDIAARFFLKQQDYRGLRQVGPPQGGGDYVIYLRKEDTRLRDELDLGIQALLDSGELKSIYDRYGLWTPAQEELVHQGATDEAELAPERGSLSILRDNAHFLLHAAGMTIVLSVASMPIAMIVGLLVALARMYGPPPLQWLAVGYDEFIRGTPLMLQLFVLYFLLPEIGIVLPDLAAGILGLALNYSAYEAEIYRTGLQAVPHGQMEAALALGMSRPLAIRRVILPQAIRIVIPPVTSDFITLLKDSSVCSAIGLVELSKQYSILVNNNGHVVMFAAVVALIYLVLSLPLSRLAHILERRLDTAGKAR
jgi:polar amino acid transport system substrate-binding protein